MTAAFVSGTMLNAGFYRDVIEPGLRSIPHSAALLGWGSDVLGYYDERSTDHGWGPRLFVFGERGKRPPVDAEDARVGEMGVAGEKQHRSLPLSADGGPAPKPW